MEIKGTMFSFTLTMHVLILKHRMKQEYCSFDDCIKIKREK